MIVDKLFRYIVLIYIIIINYLSSEKEAYELKEKIVETYDVECRVIRADVSKEEEVDQMFDVAEKEMGGVDVLVNNAAIDLSNLFGLKTADEFRRTLDVNVVGAYNCAKRVYKKIVYFTPTKNI